MKLLAIDAKNSTVKEIELDMQANTLYTYFNSILLDELTPLNGHVVYSDANALSEKKEAYFIGEQLIVGNALIIGRPDLEELDVTITKEELEKLISKDVSEFLSEVLSLISQSEINLYRNFEVIKDAEHFNLNTEWVLYTFNIADERTKEYFINELSKAIAEATNIEKFMQKMATLAVNAGQ